MTTDLKLFVWEDVLCDWSCGMVVALAHDVEEARRVYLAKVGVTTYHGVQWQAVQGEPTHIVTGPDAFEAWGGG